MVGPRKSKEPSWLKYKEKVYQIISEKQYINGLGKIVDPLPKPSKVREVLENFFKIQSNRKDFRVILVEDYANYKVFIQIPNGKSDYDFYVWRALFESDKIVDLKVPSHDDLAEFFIKLKVAHEDIEKHLVEAVIKLIHPDYRWGIPKIVSKYFACLNEELKVEVEKFLSTLKWIILQEDANYPPQMKKLGSKYTLALYVLLWAGFNMSEIRRIIRF